MWRHLCVTIAVSAGTVIISMATDCLGIVLTFNVSIYNDSMNPKTTLECVANEMQY